jgi:DNA-damage-inducible protein J
MPECSYNGTVRSSIIRARVDDALKAQATAVLDACGLEMSEALRLFLTQVVNTGGLPFPVRQAAHIVSAKKLKQMKRDSQARDRALVAEGGAVDEMFLIRPALVKQAHIIWPEVDL